MKCPVCNRNIARGGVLERFVRMTPKERRSSLAGTMSWYKKFQKKHNELMKNQNTK